MAVGITTEFRIHSIGIVAKDKERDSDIIEVFPIEHLSTYEGEIDKEPVKVEADTVDINDKPIKKKIEVRTTIRARWIAIDQPNRLTPPDVVKGETVYLYQYADDMEYRWSTLDNEYKLRRQETVGYLFGNEPRYGYELDLTNSHWFYVSSHDQFVKLHTSDNNGEYTQYDIEVDMKNGKVSIRDKLGNYILLDSKNELIRLNSMGDVDALALKNVNIVAGKNINGEAKGNVDIKAGKDIKTHSDGETKIDADRNIEITSNTKIKICAPVVEICGKFIVNGRVCKCR